MSTKRWNKTALKARLRADIAFDTAPRPVNADLASKRLDYFRIVALVESGTVSADAGAELFDTLVAAVRPAVAGETGDSEISSIDTGDIETGSRQQPAA